MGIKKSRLVWKVGISTLRGCIQGSGYARYWDLNWKDAEHSVIPGVHQTHTRFVSTDEIDNKIGMCFLVFLYIKNAMFFIDDIKC